MNTLLLATDDSLLKEALTISFEDVALRIIVASTLRDAIIQVPLADCIVSEHLLPDGSANALFDKAKGRPFILMVEQASLKHGIVAMRRGAFNCLTKPIDHKELIRSITRAFDGIKTDLTSLEMIGQSEPLERLRHQIKRVAPLDTTILISGESGTGKELVAKDIHQKSKRFGLEMISVNCAAIPDSLVDAELFGHVKGAFTSAITDRSGLIEAAHNSTLFLDKIDELSLATQSGLLRVLQEGEVRRVGSTERTYVNVRLIAATQRNLLEMVSKGSFRQDLYYQLNVIELTCPALKDRGNDVLLLANAFLKHSKQTMDRPKLSFSKESLVAMRDHPWPGNIRELKNAIERAVILSDGPAICPPDLGLKQSQAKQHFIGNEQRQSNEQRPTMSLEDYFQHFVLSHQEQLSETELAKRLGISRKSLWERRNRLGIPKHRDGDLLE